ncbi:Cytochrome P450, E-class, group I [Parasponia andersonii]|uniref:Cytochrome P450, E-class, group I n=1 Tax=Parasponia andersonii TaxID=3476 RepID=A0A2P5AE71_PARAD|nr:Cytochrome P450, E-class, group I [Parasponia andersonii]
MDLFSIVSCLFLFLLTLYLYLNFHTFPNKGSTNTGFKIYPIVGTLPGLLKNRHRLLDWYTETLIKAPKNTATSRRFGNIRAVITANPLNVEHMLKTNFENYPKGDTFVSVLGDFLGRGIFNSDGELWKVQRKTASYEFNTKSLRNFIMESVVVELETRLIPVLGKASETGRVMDLQDVLERFAFDNVCKLAFNVDPGCLRSDGTSSAEFMQAFEDAAILSSSRFRHSFPNFWKIKRLLNVGSEQRLRESISTVHEFADNIIRSRMESKLEKTEEDLLSRFIGNEYDNSPEFLRDIVTSFILAGRDSTSSALTWFFWLLSSRPKIQETILEELETIRIQNRKNIGGTFSFDELRRMQYLHAAISESMRLYPPVPSDSKVCLNDDVLPDGTFVGKGWFLTYHTYAMGRMEKIWGKDCNEFLPERWLEDGVCRQESPFRYPVFHAGPRMCLGKDMAYIQMKSIAASLIERFEIHVLNKDAVPGYIQSLTLRMKGGLPIRVGRRSSLGTKN